MVLEDFGWSEDGRTSRGVLMEGFEGGKWVVVWLLKSVVDVRIEKEEQERWLVSDWQRRMNVLRNQRRYVDADTKMQR